MAAKFVIVVKQGPFDIIRIWGNRDVDKVNIAKLISTEQFLEAITGYRFHINLIPQPDEGDNDATDSEGTEIP